LGSNFIDRNENFEILIGFFSSDFQISRCIGQLIVGNVFGQLVLMSIPGPEDLNGLNLLLLADLLAPMATALGKNSTLI
jgi:hypothetical protein